MSGLDKLMPDVDRLRVFESRLVHQLDGGKVVYCTQSCQLYFWEPPNGRLRSAIECALMSLGKGFRDQPVVMDNKGVFNKPRKLTVSGQDMKVVAAALRLAGVSICIDDTDLFAYRRTAV